MAAAAAAAADGGGDESEGGAAEGGAVRPVKSRRHVMNRVWSRPVREKRLRGPYDSPHSSDDDDDDDDERREQRVDELDTTLTLSADDDQLSVNRSDTS